MGDQLTAFFPFNIYKHSLSFMIEHKLKTQTTLNLSVLVVQTRWMMRILQMKLKLMTRICRSKSEIACTQNMGSLQYSCNRVRLRLLKKL